MTQTHPAPRASDTEPAKLPTPHRPERHDEWNRAKMVTFLKELAACQSVTNAAFAVCMSRQSAYKLRNRLAGTPFALAWEVALEAGFQQLAHEVMDRAVNGESTPKYYHGEIVGRIVKHDNRLAMWVLDNPWKVGRQQIAREYVAEGWELLLERIECENLDWQRGEDLPGRPVPPMKSERAAALGYCAGGVELTEEQARLGAMAGNKISISLCARFDLPRR
jgi:hypothetical protein